jgi:hypothetical protein
MSIPADAHKVRRVQVKYQLTTILVEYVPAHSETSRAERSLAHLAAEGCCARLT